jgi:hypothetical protein
MTNENPHALIQTGFDTPAIRMIPYWKIRFLAPEEEVDFLFDKIIEIAPLVYGKTDRNAIRAASCHEYYRPLEGTPAGAEQDTRKRPGIVEMSMAIPTDQLQLEKIIQVIYENHSYYEPPISVEPILRSQTRGLDDSENPNRWWNKAGDWKKDA